MAAEANCSGFTDSRAVEANCIRFNNSMGLWKLTGANCSWAVVSLVAGLWKLTVAGL